MGKAAVTNDRSADAIDGLQAIEITTSLARLDQIVEYDNRQAWNLITLCWYHHRLVHEGGWKIRKDAEDNLGFIRPDGRPVTKPTRLDPAVGRRMFGEPLLE